MYTYILINVMDVEGRLWKEKGVAGDWNRTGLSNEMNMRKVHDIYL